jgi:hypothetical protein
MNTLPDEIVRKIADMKIAADYCSLTVYDCWGVLFWVSRCFMDAPWFCKMSFPNTETQRFIRRNAEPSVIPGNDMIVKWTPVLTVRTKATVEALVANVFTERIGYVDGGFENPMEIVRYYYSQDGGGVPPKYQALSVVKPWEDYGDLPNIAPDAIGGSGDICDMRIKEDDEDMPETQATLIRIKMIMKQIESLVATA